MLQRTGTVEKVGLTLKLQPPHGRDIEQGHTLLLKSAGDFWDLAASNTRAACVFRVQSKGQSQSSQEIDYFLQSKRWAKSNSLGTVFALALLLLKLKMVISEDRRL